MNKRVESFEGSEEERFLKGLARCRICSHPQMMHPSIPSGCVDVNLRKNGQYKECECKEFIPKDNLAYLEWKYNKEGKK